MTSTIYTFPSPPPRRAQPEPEPEPELVPPDLGDEAFDELISLVYCIAMRDALGLDTTLERKLAINEARRLRRALGGPSPGTPNGTPNRHST